MSQINLTIDVTPEQLVGILAVITGTAPAQPSAPAAEPDETEDAPKAAPRKRAAKKAAAPKPAPEPEPDEEDEADEPEEAPQDEPAGPTQADALTRAQAVMDAHEKAGIAAVKDVLSGLGLKRVGELKDAQAGEFIELLDKAAAELDESPL